MAAVDRILVVDDLPEVRRRIAQALAPLESEVVEAADGEEALELLSRAPAGVVITDVRMPRLDGLGLLRALRDSGTPVIMHSGYADVQAAVRALRLGAVDFLSPPFDYEQLRSRVSRCLRRFVHAGDRLIGSSAVLGEIRGTIGRIADAPGPVLITGETGVGKEVVARSLHAQSRRRAAPFVVVNVGALSESLLESELFGHEKGAFTGALGRRQGRFEQARGGTILLDEIGDAPPRVQAELLRVVETRTVERVGGERPIEIDVRVLAATHRSLPRAIAQGRFRDDLWYRLSAFRIHVPPLRERRQDVDDLVRAELAELSGREGGAPADLDAEGYARLRRQAWPGNVRQLLLAVRRMLVLAGRRRVLDASDVERALDIDEPEAWDEAAEPLGSGADAEAPHSRTEFLELERERIVEVLNATRWNVSAAARRLRTSRSGLRYRMQRLGIED
jgi:DNA-binding NtrC family response regulator